MLQPPGTFDTASLRRASGADTFPYRERHVTFLLIAAEGTVTQAQTLTDKRSMLARLADGDLLLAAWTGNYRTDIFVLDDLELVRSELR